MSGAPSSNNMLAGINVTFVNEPSNNGSGKVSPAASDPGAGSSSVSLPKFPSSLSFLQKATNLGRKASKAVMGVVSRSPSPVLSNAEILEQTELAIQDIQKTRLFQLYNEYLESLSPDVLLALKKEAKRLGMKSSIVDTVRIIAEGEGNEKAINALGGSPLSYGGSRKKLRKTLKKRRSMKKRKLSRRK